MKLSEQLQQCVNGHDYEIVHYWFRDVVAGSRVITSLLVDKKCTRCGFALDNMPTTNTEREAICKMDGIDYKD